MVATAPRWEAAARQAARIRRRLGSQQELRCNFGSFPDTEGAEVLKDGTELHRASLCLADAVLRRLRLEGTADPIIKTLKAKYADVLGGALQDMPQDSGMELELEKGDACIPRS